MTNIFSNGMLNLKTNSLALKRLFLSYDATVFRWIMSFNKKCIDHTCINTLVGMRNVIDDVCNNNLIFH